MYNKEQTEQTRRNENHRNKETDLKQAHTEC